MSFHLNPWFLITLLGTPELWLGIAGGVGVFYFIFRKNLGKRRKTLRGFAMVFVVSLLLTFGVVQGIKSTVNIPRPCGQENPYCEPDSSFPSGHAAAIFVFFGPLLIFLKRMWLPLLVIPLLVAYSRVALGVHTLADVAAGGVLGVVIPLVIFEILGMGKKI